MYIAPLWTTSDGMEVMFANRLEESDWLKRQFPWRQTVLRSGAGVGDAKGAVVGSGDAGGGVGEGCAAQAAKRRTQKRKEIIFIMGAP